MSRAVLAISDSQFTHSPSIEDREQNSVQEGGPAVEPQVGVDVPARRELHRTVTTILRPTPQKDQLSQEFLARFNTSILSPSAKAGRFWKECLHPARVEKVPYAERKGIWSYSETRADCDALLAKYETATYQSPETERFLKTFCTGFKETLAKLHDRLHKKDAKFAKEFHKLFDYGNSGPDSRAPFERIFRRLERERSRMEAPFDEFPMIFQALAKVRSARGSLSETVLVFPSIQGSGELSLPKLLEQDGLLVEQFYADYIQMLQMNDLYLHCFMRSITKGFSILDNK